MKSIFYLCRKQFKNRLISLKNNPGMLVLYTVLAVLFIGMIAVSVSPMMEHSEISAEDGAKYFSGVCTAIFMLFAYITLFSGLNSGNSFFTLSDVHLLFPSPIKPKTILLYGMAKQVGTSFLMCIFIAFQGANLRNLGIDVSGMVLIYFGLFFTLLMSSLTTSVIYSYTNGSVVRKKITQVVLYASIFIIMGFIAKEHSVANDILNSALSTVNSSVFDFVPIYGWAKGLMSALYFGNYTTAIIWGAVIIVYSIVMYILIARSNGEFYEDAISGAQRKAELKAIQRANGSNMGGLSLKKKFKIKAQGISSGRGTGTIFFKQILEQRRKGIAFVDATTLIMGIVVVGVSLATKSLNNNTVSLLFSFGIAGYMALFLNMSGPWVNEMKKPFIYLIPGSNFKKLFLASISSILKGLADAAVIFGIAGFILEISFLQWAVCVVAFSGFGFVYTAGDILCKRIFKRQINKGILNFIYFIMLVVLIIPSVIIALIVGFMLAVVGFELFALLAFLAVNILVYLLMLLLCRNLLSNMEFDG